MGEVAGIVLNLLQDFMKQAGDAGTKNALVSEKNGVAVPESLLEANEIKKYWANTGDFNADTQKAESQNIMQQGISGLREMDPGSAMEAMSNLYTKSEMSNRQIDMADQDILRKNSNDWADFMATKLTPAQEKVADTKRAIDYSIMDQDRQAMDDKMGSITNVLGGVLNLGDPTSSDSIWNKGNLSGIINGMKSKSAPDKFSPAAKSLAVDTNQTSQWLNGISNATAIPGDTLNAGGIMDWMDLK